MEKCAANIRVLVRFIISERLAMSTSHARRLCQSSPETKPEEGEHSGNKTMQNGWTWNNNIR
jgi:hypothetical protein